MPGNQAGVFFLVLHLFPLKKIQNIEKYAEKREKLGKHFKNTFINFIFQKFKKRCL